VRYQCGGFCGSIEPAVLGRVGIKLLHSLADTLLDRVKPILKKMVGCVGCRMQCLRLRAMDSHGGVVSIGALTPNRLGCDPGDYVTFNFHQLRYATPLEFAYTFRGYMRFQSDTRITAHLVREQGSQAQLLPLRPHSLELTTLTKTDYGTALRVLSAFMGSSTCA
jgi:hypothetical protein